MAEPKLTPQQQAVVENRGGTLLVSAAAGSGKTKVLVDRVIRRVRDENLDIHRFLIITFTNAAAAELRLKISQAISKELAKAPGNRHLARQLSLLQLAQISTVHAFCGALIREYGYTLEVPPDFRLIDAEERNELLAGLLDDLMEERYAEAAPDFLLLSDTLGGGRSDAGLVELVLTLYEKVLSQPDPQGWLAKQDPTIPEDVDMGQTFWGKILIEECRRRISWMILRYEKALETMRGDALLEAAYVPAFSLQLSALRNMDHVLDGPWDEIAGGLQMDNPRVSVRKYPDEDRKKALLAVKNESVKALAAMANIFSRSQTELKSEQNALAPALRALMDLTAELDRRFAAEKRRKNLLDFSDQEHLAIRLLVHPETGRPTEVARDVSARFAEIMVDEYQDSNYVQETIFTAISRARDENRFLVGDVKQSIYGFRQAEPGMFLEKYDQYPYARDAGEGEPRKLILSRNFRSRPGILEAVNHTFRTVMSREVGDITYDEDQALYPGLEEYPALSEPGVELHVLSLGKLSEEQKESKYQREARFVANRIVEMLREGTPVREDSGVRPVRPSDFAILLRTRDPIGIYAAALEKAGVPVAADSGGNVFETPEVRMLVNLLRVLNNPHQDIPLLAVLCSPVFRLSNDQLAQIRASGKQARFYDAMRVCDAPWCTEALGRLESLRSMAGSISADRLIWRLLHGTGLLTAVSAMEGGAARRENLMTVYQYALSFASGTYLYLYELLRILDRAARSGTLTSQKRTEGVEITTIHGSKGLEYPVVILSDLSHRFNFRDLNNDLIYDGSTGIAAKITDVNLRIRYPGICYGALTRKLRRRFLSEEMRILYVAMTRPKDYLIMTYASEYCEGKLKALVPAAGQTAGIWAVADAACMGDWVLLSALNRIESGALFEISGHPLDSCRTSDYPWRVTYQTIDQQETEVWNQTGLGQELSAHTYPDPDRLAALLLWRDPHAAAARTPSKVTATQLKGRKKDEEAAEHAKVRPSVPQMQRPRFVVEAQGLSPTEQGTAVHLFLQYADYARCTTEDGVTDEKYRLEDGEFMTEQQLSAVKPEAIVRLFQSPLGRRLLDAPKLVREFKFSLLDDAETYYPEATGERILLQGVVDAAIIAPDGITVIDFKSDRVTKDSMRMRAEVYRGQLQTYRRALERIFAKPVKETILWFLTVGEEVRL